MEKDQQGRRRRRRRKRLARLACYPGHAKWAGQQQLTSFSPQMWLMVETEAGLEAGPMTETTPLGKI